MAKGVKSGGKDFPKGVSGNPKGRPPLPADLKNARKLNQREVERIFNDILFTTKEQLLYRYEHPDTPAIERMLIKLVRSASATGDSRRITFLLERLVGKVETKVRANEEEKPVGKRVEEMTDEELEAQAKEIATKLKRGA